MDASLRRAVVQRAENRCEYCRLPQSAAPLLLFHVEHILAQQHVNDDSFDNLALACPDCNRHKGPNLTTLDPTTKEIISLFHPRRDVWNEHFKFHGAQIVGLTIVGSATIRLLQMNRDDRVELRRELIDNNEL